MVDEHAAYQRPEDGQAGADPCSPPSPAAAAVAAASASSWHSPRSPWCVFKNDEERKRRRENLSLHHAVNEGVPHLVHDGGGLGILQLEDALNNGELSARGVHAGEGAPVVDHHARTDEVATAVDGSRHQGDLKQGRELVLVLNAGPRVHQSTLVAEGTVAAHQHLSRDRLPEHLHLQSVRNDFLSFLCDETNQDSQALVPQSSREEGGGEETNPVNVGMDQGNVVVAGHDISEGREPLLHSGDLHRIWN